MACILNKYKLMSNVSQRQSPNLMNLYLILFYKSVSTHYKRAFPSATTVTLMHCTVRTNENDAILPCFWWF